MNDKFNLELNNFIDKLYTYIQDNIINNSYKYNLEILILISEFTKNNNVSITVETLCYNKIIMYLNYENNKQQKIVISLRLAKLKQIFNV